MRELIVNRERDPLPKNGITEQLFQQREKNGGKIIESSKTCSDATGILLHQGLPKNMAPIPSLKCQVPGILAYPLWIKIEISQNPSLLAKNIRFFVFKKRDHGECGSAFFVSVTACWC